MLFPDIFNFLLDECCLSIYYLVNEFFQDNEDKKITKTEAKEFEKFIVSFAPLLAHSILFEMVSHPTLSNLIRNEIDKIKISEEQSDVKLFVLFFMLIETNLKNEIEQVDSLIYSIKYWNVLNSILFKLLSFIAFKSNGDKDLLDKLKKYTTIVFLKMYPDKASSDVNQMIDNLKLKGVAEIPSNTLFDVI